MGNLLHGGGGMRKAWRVWDLIAKLGKQIEQQVEWSFPYGFNIGRLVNCCWGNLQTEQLKMQFEGSYAWYGMSKGTRELLVGQRWAPCIGFNLSTL